MNENKVDLKNILDKIDHKELILPDFQREYVWSKDEDKIIDFIASILAQLPIGSIITFKNAYNSFANKEIGFNKPISFGANQGDVYFLLDGQQRITTLDLVFSDRIFQKIKDDPINHSKNYLVQKTNINKRFFIKLPKYNSDVWTNDFFGLERLDFPFDPKHVEFCSNQISDLIITKQFTINEIDSTNDEWYSPKSSNYPKYKLIDIYKENAASECLIPLSLIIDNQSILNEIITEIASKRRNILSYIYDIQNIDNIKNYIKENNDLYPIDLSSDDETIYKEFNAILTNLQNNWAKSMYNYLCYCVEAININEFNIDDKNTSRAINMYEALNKGGAKLTTYDLIIARAGTQSSYGTKSFAERNKELLSDYCNMELFDVLCNLTCSSAKDWNSNDYFHTITKTNEIVPSVVSQYLNLLCFVSNKADNDKKIPRVHLEKIPNDYCKAKKQLDMTSEMIVNYSDIVLESLIDTFMVLQFLCGIPSIKQVDYNLILFPLSYAMYLYKSESIDISLKSLAKFICGLYRYLIFTGCYVSDQSTEVMKHVELVHNWLLCDEVPSKFSRNSIRNTLKDVLNIPKYNDFDVLTLKPDLICKKAVRNSLLHYQLSLNAPDILMQASNSVYLNGYSYLDLEIHHVVPLASAKTIKESTKQLRKEQIILNSPLNLAFISKKANRDISSLDVKRYSNDICDEFLSRNCFDLSIKNFLFDRNRPEEFAPLLKKRYDELKAKITDNICDCFYLITT